MWHSCALSLWNSNARYGGAARHSRRVRLPGSGDVADLQVRKTRACGGKLRTIELMDSYFVWFGQLDRNKSEARFSFGIPRNCLDIVRSLHIVIVSLAGAPERIGPAITGGLQVQHDIRCETIRPRFPHCSASRSIALDLLPTTSRQRETARRQATHRGRGATRPTARHQAIDAPSSLAQIWQFGKIACPRGLHTAWQTCPVPTRAHGALHPSHIPEPYRRWVVAKRSNPAARNAASSNLKRTYRSPDSRKAAPASSRNVWQESVPSRRF